MISRNLIIIGGLLGAILLICIYRPNVLSMLEGYDNPRIQNVSQNVPQGVSMVNSNELSVAPIPYNENVLPYPQISNPYSSQGEFVPPSSCEGKDTLNPISLLPTQQPNSPFELSNPTVPAPLEGKNFLESTKNFGIDTVGSSLRNANYQLRSDPFIKPVETGPWSQGTIAPDTSHRYFELGSS